MKNADLAKPQPGAAHDPANGWDQVAAEFIAIRQHAEIGVAALQQWAKNLPAAAQVLDLGCGFGEPVAAALIAEGCSVYGIDASPLMLAEFNRRFPKAPVKCATVEEAEFERHTFESIPVENGRLGQPKIKNSHFDAVVAIGLLFLLPAQSQQWVIKKAAAVLNPGGFLLFSSPFQACCWHDLLTGRESISLGRQVYLAWCEQCGFKLQSEFADEGGNHYFCFVKQHQQMQHQ